MGSRISICVIIIFALAFARANVYGQVTSGDTVGGSVGLDQVDARVFWEGIDSLLKSHGLTTDSVNILGDTLDRHLLTRIGVKSHINASAELVIGNILGYTKFFKDGWRSDDKDKQFESRDFIKKVVAVDGSITYLNNRLEKIPFSFTRSLTLIPLGDYYMPDTPSSFWDSTAKPILVTLGAAAVIALFFLIRG